MAINRHLFPIWDSTFRNPNRMVKLAAMSKFTGSGKHIMSTILLSWPLWIYRQIACTLDSRAFQ